MKSRMFFRSWWTLQKYHKNAQRRSLKTPPPSYIGNQVSLLHDPDYLGLSAHHRGQLHGMLLLAATDAGHVPSDPVTIASCLRLEHCDDLSYFEQWLVKCDARCYHSPEGYDSKGVKVSTPSKRRPSAASTPCFNKGKGKGKGKVKESTARGTPRATTTKAIEARELVAYVRRFFPDCNENIRTARSLLKSYGMQACKAGVCLVVDKIAAQAEPTRPYSLSYFKGPISELHSQGDDAYQLHAISSIERRYPAPEAANG